MKNTLFNTTTNQQSKKKKPFNTAINKQKTLLYPTSIQYHQQQSKKTHYKQ
jgi:hypothetical protein